MMNPSVWLPQQPTSKRISSAEPDVIQLSDLLDVLGEGTSPRLKRRDRGRIRRQQVDHKAKIFQLEWENLISNVPIHPWLRQKYEYLVTRFLLKPVHSINF